MSNKKKSFIFLGGVILFAFLIYGLQEINHSSLFKKKIEDHYRAVAIEKYNPRKSMNVLTSLRIKRENGEIEGFPMRQEIMNYIEVGDSIIKVKDENLCYIVKPDGERKAFYYVRIPMKTRNHWTFPEEWKDKWMESSEWDR